MTKIEEAYEVIESTIVSNKERGISAQVLKNAFNTTLAAVEEAGTTSEGGSGALVVYPFYFLSSILGVSTREGWELLKIELEAEMNSAEIYIQELCQEFINTIDECFEQNAKAYNIIINNASNGDGTFVISDIGKDASSYYKLIYGAGNITMGELSVATCLPSLCVYEAYDSQYICGIVPCSNEFIDSKEMAPFLISENGDVEMFIYECYIPEEGQVLTEEEKEANKNANGAYETASYLFGDGDSYHVEDIHIVDVTGYTVRYFDGLDVKEIVFTEDGNATVKTIGTISSENTENKTVTFYTTVSGEITDEQKAKNLSSFESYVSGVPVSVMVSSDDMEATYHPYITSYNTNEDGASGLAFIQCVFPGQTATGSPSAMLFYSDGSVMMQME